MLFKRLLPAIIFSVLVSSCGLVDTEAAGEAIAQKEQVLRIQTEQLDPLLDELSGFQSQIEPFEQEIEDHPGYAQRRGGQHPDQDVAAGRLEAGFLGRFLHSCNTAYSFRASVRQSS